ncbi:MAG: ABC transporter permease [Spirochaetaceae bacterium]|nr:ABC transporter permease [Spirochaetaceae bacterium]
MSSSKSSLQNEKQSLKHRFLTILAGDKSCVLAIPVFCVILSMIAACILLLVLGKSPLAAFTAFLRGSGFLPKPSYAGGQNMFTDFLSFLGILAPMLLAALSVITALKAGMFNIGVAGQMLASGFIALVFVGYSPLNGFLAKPLVLIIGIVCGAVLGAAVGALKAKFNIHEVVSTIMFNYIISYITGFFINNYYIDPLTRSSKICSGAARLTLTDISFANLKPALPLGIIVALCAVFIMHFVLNKTTLGFKIKTVGLNPFAAKYAGIKQKNVVVLSMMISGSLAGLAGVCYFLGYYNTILPKTLPDMGFDAIAISLLGNLSPIGSVFASILVTILQKGDVYMSSRLKVPPEISSVIIGFLLLFSACGIFIRHYAKKHLDKLDEAKGA